MASSLEHYINGLCKKNFFGRKPHPVLWPWSEGRMTGGGLAQKQDVYGDTPLMLFSFFTSNLG